jgi:hypothetical protein
VEKYKELTNDEIEYYKSLLELPNEKYPYYNPLIVDGVEVHTYTGEKLLSGEEFRKNKTYSLRVSNYGRIEIGGEIKKLFVDDTFQCVPKVYIPQLGYSIGTYRLIKETFCPIENMEKLEVHHITNNGFYVRPEDLIWVTKSDHFLIENDFRIKMSEISKEFYRYKIEIEFGSPVCEISGKYTKNDNPVFMTEIKKIKQNFNLAEINLKILQKNNIITVTDEYMILTRRNP